jgi:hypothetical protein
LGSRHSPCDLGRFRAGLSGFLSLPLQPVFKAGRSPSCGLPPSTKPTNHPSTAPASAIAGAPLLRFGPLQRATIPGARMTRSFHLSGTFRPQGFAPSRRLSSPETLRGLFHPRCAHGVPADDSPALARAFRLQQGDGAHVSSARLSLPPRRTGVDPLSSHTLRRSIYGRSSRLGPVSR